MAVTNFIPSIWSHKIQEKLEMETKLFQIGTKKYEGDFKYGASVHILAVGEPTTSSYHGYVEYEDLNDVGQILPIDFAEYFAFNVDDIDKRQSIPGLPEGFQKKAGLRLAQRRDINFGRLIAGECYSTVAESTATFAKTSDVAIAPYKDYFVATTSPAGTTVYKRVAKPVVAGLSNYYEITSVTKKAGASNVTTASAKTQAGIKTAIDDAFTAMYLRNNDEGSMKLLLDPVTYGTFKNNLTELSTNNPELIRKGVIGMYNDAPVIMSNAIYTNGSYHFCALLTNDAIATASQIQKVEALRLEGKFGDGIRGLDVYGMGIIDQDQLEAIKVPV